MNLSNFQVSITSAAVATLLLYKIQEEYWPTLKSFLLFLNILVEDELPNVKENEEVYKVLKEL